MALGPRCFRCRLQILSGPNAVDELSVFMCLMSCDWKIGGGWVIVNILD